ncbi:MAG: hypothetical protein ABJD11_10070 [Gemmatimonadota bacterium]
MEAVLTALIAGGTVAVSMYFAYLSTKAKAQASIAARNSRDDSAMRAELEVVHQQLAELAERMDFTERLLARQCAAERLGQLE